MPIRKSGISGGAIPFGESSDRPTPTTGQPFFNGEESRLELYTSNGWQNIVQETPGIVAISGTYLEFGGSQQITINGTNFVPGAVAFAVGGNNVEVAASSTTVISSAEAVATFSNLSSDNAPYDIKITNPSNLFGIIYGALNVDDSYIWDVQSGTLGTYLENATLSVITTSIFDEQNSPVTFSITNGTLPPGTSINNLTGQISGILQNVIPDTTYNFTISATNGINAATRNFSITVTDQGPTWETSQTLPAFTANNQYSQTIQATDDDGIASYTVISGSMPSGLSLNSSTGVISGIPTSALTATFIVRATDLGGRYADRQFTIPNTGPIINTLSLPGGQFDSQYSTTISATDDGPVNFSVSSGSLPSSLSLNQVTGVISGTLTSSSTFTIRVTDENLNFSEREFTIVAAISSVYTSSTTATLPAGNYRALLVGGGGGGRTGHDGGGGSGRISYADLGFRAAGTWTINIGAGGSGGPSGNSGANGGNGGTSSIVFDGSQIASAAGGDGFTSKGGNAGNNGGSGGGGGGNGGTGGAGGTNGGTGGSSASNAPGGDGQGSSFSAALANTQYPVTNYNFRAGAGGAASGGSHQGGGGGGGVNASNVSVPSQSSSGLSGTSGVGFGSGGAGGGYNGPYYAGGSGLSGVIYIWSY